MQLRSKKNDFSLSFWIDDKRVFFMEYVNSIPKVKRWLDAKGIDWKYCNIYERRTRKFIERQYKD